MTSKGGTDSIETQVIFDVRKIANELEKEETYWLVVDRSGKGNFLSNNTDYYPVKNDLKEGKAIFENVIWDIDQSGSDVFTLAIGNELLPVIEIENPLCETQQLGTISIEIVGGKAPYELIISDDITSNFYQEIIYDEQLFTIENVAFGDYQILVKDANNETTKASINIQAADAPELLLKKEYELEDGMTLKLDASNNLSHLQTYQWIGPEGFLQNRPDISIDKTGSYELTIEQEGCLARQIIEVIPKTNQLFNGVNIYPNPAPNGAVSYTHLTLPTICSV